MVSLITALLFVVVCTACVERERGLSPLPTVGPGLHLFLWEKDSSGGAGEGLHILQTCESVTKCTFTRNTVTSVCCCYLLFFFQYTSGLTIGIGIISSSSCCVAFVRIFLGELKKVTFLYGTFVTSKKKSPI